MEHPSRIPDPTPLLSRAGRVTGLACPEPGCQRSWRGRQPNRYRLHWRVTHHNAPTGATARPEVEHRG